MQGEIGEPGLLGHLATGGIRGGLPRLEVPLGEPPVPVGIADQQEANVLVRPPPEDYAAGARLPLSPSLPLRHRPRIR